MINNRNITCDGSPDLATFVRSNVLLWIPHISDRCEVAIYEDILGAGMAGGAGASRAEVPCDAQRSLLQGFGLFSGTSKIKWLA